MKKYEGVKEFINDLIDNEGVRFSDNYGRHWIYCDYKFMHRDLGEIEWSDGLFCLHLYSSGISKEI